MTSFMTIKIKKIVSGVQNADIYSFDFVCVFLIKGIQMVLDIKIDRFGIRIKNFNKLVASRNYEIIDLPA